MNQQRFEKQAGAGYKGVFQIFACFEVAGVSTGQGNSPGWRLHQPRKFDMHPVIMGLTLVTRHVPFCRFFYKKDARQNGTGFSGETLTILLLLTGLLFLRFFRRYHFFLFTLRFYLGWI
jgi:hypothetical protein